MSTATSTAAADSFMPGQSTPADPLDLLAPLAPSAAEARQLDEQGFVILEGVIDPAWCAALAQRLDDLEGAVPVVDELRSFQVEPGTARLANLVDQGGPFEHLWCHPRILGCVRHVLRRPFKLSSLNAREPKAGQGHQGLHADWGPHQPGEPFHVVNSLWLLDPFLPDNGATRVVPGSHLLPGAVGDHVADAAAPHPRELRVQAPAGTVVVFNAHCWHGGTVNRSGARRRVVHCYYTAREHAQQQEQRRWLAPETIARQDAGRRWLLDL